MAAKPALSFGFSKKAEPKRHVAALSTKEKDEREEIRGVEEGQLALEKPKEAQGPPVIACKNPLDGSNAPKKLKPNLPNGEKRTILEKPLEELPGGIVSKNIEKLSNEDAEAMRELLKDAAREDDGEDAPAAVPILMKEGSKKVREGSAPEATKEMFETVAVESFGEAMLRGMGYDPNVHKTQPIVRDKLRDTLLGLGAKALLPGEKAQIQGKKKIVPIAPASAGAPATSANSAIAAAATEATAPSSEVNASKASPSAASVSMTSGGAVSSQPSQKRRRTEDADANVRPVGAPDNVWASRGLVVRIISKEGNLKNFFGAEAVVLEVDESGSCRIKARPNGGDKSEQLKGVPLEHIETRVSRDCQKVRVVRGAQKGTIAKLMKRDATRGVAVVRVEGAEKELALDDVCQFME